MSKKESNVLRGNGSCLIKCTLGDFEMHIYDGCTAREVMQYVITYRSYSMLGAYSLTTEDGRRLDEDTPVPNDRVLIFHDLGGLV